MSYGLYTNISLHSTTQFPTLHDHHRHFTFKIPTLRRNSSVLRATTSANNHLLASLREAATTSTLLLLGLTLRVSPAASTPLTPAAVVEEKETVTQDVEVVNGESKNGVVRSQEEKQNDEFEAWKSKTYALSVPLKVVALRGSIPPSWVKDFMQSQGKRVRFQVQYLGSIENIFSDLSMSLSKSKIGPKSTMAADIVTTGDSWLSHAIKKGIIEPIRGAEEQDWFKTLSDKWKTYLCRNHEGKVDPKGEVWAVPYRWGCMVIVYKQSKFRKYNLAPIEDWSDLWRPELAGRISMVDSPREVIGAVLKFMGASYNTQNMELEVPGGRNAVQQNLALLAKQIRLFDSTNYLKSFSVGDAWVSIGWSSDVIPMAKRMSNVAVVIPKSGTSLWTDLWVIPAASKINSNQIGGRIRGPSPLIHQWLEFCLQAARALPFKQEVIPGATPSAIESIPAEVPEELTKGKPKLDTNLIAGVPPPEIMAKCEFLEPLSDTALTDYNLLISSLKDNVPGLVQTIRKLMK